MSYSTPSGLLRPNTPRIPLLPIPATCRPGSHSNRRAQRPTVSPAYHTSVAHLPQETAAGKQWRWCLRGAARIGYGDVRSTFVVWRAGWTRTSVCRVALQPSVDGCGGRFRVEEKQNCGVGSQGGVTGGSYITNKENGTSCSTVSGIVYMYRTKEEKRDVNDM
jgi:hypothetical protein